VLTKHHYTNQWIAKTVTKKIIDRRQNQSNIKNHNSEKSKTSDDKISQNSEEQKRRLQLVYP